MTAPLRRRLRRLTACDSGVAAVEFAILAPVMILLMVGIVETGRALFARATISYALADTARWAYTHCGVDDDSCKVYVAQDGAPPVVVDVLGIEAAVRQELKKAAFGAELADAHITFPTPPAGDCSDPAAIGMVISVSYPYKTIFSDAPDPPWWIPFGGDTLTFTETLAAPLQCWPS